MTAIDTSGLCECGCGRATTIATRTDISKGTVKGQPKRFIRGHKPPRRPGPLYEVDSTTGCWVWLRHRSPKGYGTMRHNRRVRFAHRVFYEQHVGPIPAGLELDHLCRNRGCVNPDHLEPVTHAENVRRGRLARLTPADVEAIRASEDGPSTLAERYGITPGYVHDIRTGRSWSGS